MLYLLFFLLNLCLISSTSAQQIVAERLIPHPEFPNQQQLEFSVFFEHAHTEPLTIDLYQASDSLFLGSHTLPEAPQARQLYTVHFPWTEPMPNLPHTHFIEFSGQQSHRIYPFHYWRASEKHPLEIRQVRYLSNGFFELHLSQPVTQFTCFIADIPQALTHSYFLEPQSVIILKIAPQFIQKNIPCLFIGRTAYAKRTFFSTRQKLNFLPH